MRMPGLACLALLAGTLVMPVAWAAAPELPTGAKALSSRDEVVQALTGGPRKVTVYDMGPNAFTVQSVYDWKKKTIHIDTGDKKLDLKWDVKGSKFCVVKEPCRTIYLQGSKVFEVNPDGKVHATSEPL